ncbi:glutathione S-transferase family protein [Rubrimonas cliftonensis]|uniref:Glutathione S-transferase n=1 Tax=Rubrimonas cliftonensis TaxID=89524 RepID=A0A1H4B6X5_9RHOB|nr:glutathione S-transferase N-terminal domain-containing protein [Rubrimonas cliftonensis]SEA43857.1 glutathione S-transferase [Rubrimonas cliftonensis]
MSMTLWGRKNSSNVQKALWALRELGLAFEHVRVGGGFGGMDDPAYRAINPNGYVPTLKDGELVLFESDAILRYLARAYGHGALWTDEADFALADQWTTWNTATLYPAVAALFFPTVRTPKALQDISMLEHAAAALAARVAVLERALEGREHLCGGFSFADIGPAISARRALLLPHGAPPATPNVAAWLARVTARPAFAPLDQPIGTCLEEWMEIEAAHG